MAVHIELLQRLKSERTLVEVYRDRYGSEALTAIVIDFNDTFVYLALYAEDGYPNGISVTFLIDVTRIRWGGNVRQSIAELIEAKGAELRTPPLDLSSTRAVLESVNAAFGYVNALLESARDDITFIGQLQSIDDKSFVVNEFGTMETRAGSSLWLKIEDVTRVDAGASYEEDIQFLAQKRGQI